MSRKEISVDLSNLIVKLSCEGKSYGFIANLLGKSRTKIQTIVKNFETNGNVLSKPRSGRPKVMSDAP